MRVLCLRFRKEINSSWADVFLRFSPCVAVRTPSLIFLEVSSTAPLFGGEKNLQAKAEALGEELSGDRVQGAVAGTAPTAQVLSRFAVDSLAEAPLEALVELEGLHPWEDSDFPKRVIESLRQMGVRGLAEVLLLPATSWRERWGSRGEILWRRLCEKDRQVISPHQAREPFYTYLYFEDALGRLSFLEHALRPALRELFLRLAGRGCFAKILTIILHGEFSEKKWTLSVAPATPGRDQDLFLDLLLKKCEGFDFLNPVKEVELLVEDVPELNRQLDFFEPREAGTDRWQRLLSFARMAGIQMGFIERKAGIFPEERVRFVEADVQHFESQDRWESEGGEARLKAVYDKDFFRAPRPALMLASPRRLQASEMSRWRKWTTLPTERWVGEWWSGDPSAPAAGRDYFFAESEDGRVVWIYRDRVTGDYYLQGAFD